MRSCLFYGLSTVSSLLFITCFFILLFGEGQHKTRQEDNCYDQEKHTQNALCPTCIASVSFCAVDSPGWFSCVLSLVLFYLSVPNFSCPLSLATCSARSLNLTCSNCQGPTLYSIGWHRDRGKGVESRRNSRGNARIFELFLILVLIGCISQNRPFSVLGFNPQIIFKNGPVVFCYSVSNFFIFF